jgi:predicted small metal-binding protein
LGVMMEVTCRCGWTTRGSKSEVIASIQAHGRAEHQQEITPAEVRAIWRTVENGTKSGHRNGG